MKAGHQLLGLLFIFSAAVATAVEPDGKQPFPHVSPGMTSLQSFLNCIESGKDLETVGVCTKSFFDNDISQGQRKRLLSWFIDHKELTEVVCDEKVQKRAQKKYMGPEIHFVCSVKKGEKKPEQVTLFVLKKLDSQYKLLNLIERPL